MSSSSISAYGSMGIPSCDAPYSYIAVCFFTRAAMASLMLGAVSTVQCAVTKLAGMQKTG